MIHEHQFGQLRCQPDAAGLSSENARQRLVDAGHNELPSKTERNTLAIALSVAREPMILLLNVSYAPGLQYKDTIPSPCLPKGCTPS